MAFALLQLLSLFPEFHNCQVFMRLESWVELKYVARPHLQRRQCAPFVRPDNLQLGTGAALERLLVLAWHSPEKIWVSSQYLEIKSCWWRLRQGGKGGRRWHQVQLETHLRSLEQVCHLSANRPIRTQTCRHRPMGGQEQVRWLVWE